MAKAKKRLQKAPSAHSRAARRNATAMDVDLPLDASKTDSTSTKSGSRGNTSSHITGGISKKKQAKPMKRQQRIRWEKGIARADIVRDQMEKKVSESKRKGKKIKERRAPWEDMNGEEVGLEKTSQTQPAVEDVITTDAEKPVTQESTLNTETFTAPKTNVEFPKPHEQQAVEDEIPDIS